MRCLLRQRPSVRIEAEAVNMNNAHYDQLSRRYTSYSSDMTGERLDFQRRRCGPQHGRNRNWDLTTESISLGGRISMENRVV